MKKTLLVFISIFISITVFSQKYNKTWLETFSSTRAIEYQKKKSEADAYAKLNNLLIKQVLPDGTVIELQEIKDGVPQYYITDNAGASQTSRANTLYSGGSLGLSVTGSGYSKVGEWDGGKVRNTHQEFGSRITLGDSYSITSDHATHVAGTIIAAGVDASAKGMAFEADLTTYYWDSDESEMAAAAAGGMEISNHSYGYARGWRWNGSSWDWYGNTSISSIEDYLFGFYDSGTKDWDDIAYNAPYYLICKSAGNDRGDGPGATPATAEKDGGDDGYDCIGTKGVAKNILTIGAVNELQEYTGPSDVVMSSFSSWGPADDGRIKPDIVAKGVSVYSSSNSADNGYTTMSGTSMSSPSATGTLVLLQQHYQNTHSGAAMKASTLKALAINTADEAGPYDGPDYMFGWGLLNAERAASRITEDQTADVIAEQVLSEGGTYTINITTAGTTGSLKVTVVWTDPSGTPVAASLDPSDAMLVNDLDLRITQASNTYYPWKLDVNNPANAATQLSENNVDNVEEVYIASPASSTTYTITVDHDGTLSGGSQAFSIIISGDIDFAVEPVANFSADNTSPSTYQTVTFSDLSNNIPTSWLWSFSPSTVTYVGGTSATSQNPQVEFTSDGDYTVQLTATNAYGNDIESKSDYIAVSTLLSYCGASGGGSTWISGVEMGTISNTGTVADSYTNYTSLSTEVLVNKTYNITITYGDAYTVDDLGIWIDFNQDGDFDDSGENVNCIIGLTYTVETYSLSIPDDAMLGSTTMRIRLKYIGDECSSPCGTTTYGEVEDYKINVLPGTDNWLGNTSDWNSTSNWSDGKVPNGSYKVIIPTGVTSPVIQSGTNAKCYSITLQDGATITINGNLEVEN